MVYINYNLLVSQGQDLPLGISISILDTNAFLQKPKILGLSRDGRLGLDTGSKTINNGTAKGYAVVGPGDDRLGLGNTIKDEINRIRVASAIRPCVQSAWVKWLYVVVPLILVVCVYILLRRYWKVKALTEVTVVMDPPRWFNPPSPNAWHRGRLDRDDYFGDWPVWCDN